MHTVLSGRRIVGMLVGDQLPRISQQPGQGMQQRCRFRRRAQCIIFLRIIGRLIHIMPKNRFHMSLSACQSISRSMEGAHGTDQEEFVDRPRQRVRGVDRDRHCDVLTIFNNTQIIPYIVRLATTFHLVLAVGRGGRFAVTRPPAPKVCCPAIATLRPARRHGSAALRRSTVCS